jgi:hypothetical protein
MNKNELEELHDKIDWHDRQDSIEVIWGLIEDLDIKNSSKNDYIECLENIKREISEFI